MQEEQNLHSRKIGCENVRIHTNGNIDLSGQEKKTTFLSGKSLETFFVERRKERHNDLWG